jgi:hypothetical protein
MLQKLETVLKHVDEISNNVNRLLIHDYLKYLVSRDTSTFYQKDNIKLIYMFVKFLGESKTFYDVKDSETIVTFLDTRSIINYVKLLNIIINSFSSINHKVQRTTITYHSLLYYLSLIVS